MATISIDIPSGVTNRVITALCVTHGVAVSQANAKQEIINMIIARVKAYEGNIASQSALTTAQADVDTNIVLSQEVNL